MSVPPTPVLLVGSRFTQGSALLERLSSNGCACTVARTLTDAIADLRAAPFDYTLSEMRLPEGSALPLLALLEGTPATLFFFVSVHNGCWWLPALARGRRVWGRPALRPAEFAQALASLLGRDALRDVEHAPPGAGQPGVIPMPPYDPSPPRPRRLQIERTKSRKASA